MLYGMKYEKGYGVVNMDFENIPIKIDAIFKERNQTI